MENQQQEALVVAAQVVLPEPAGWRYPAPDSDFHYYEERRGFPVECKHLNYEPLYTEQQVRELLATSGQAQADALDAARWSEIGKSIERACGELPEDFEITIHLENGAGTVVLLYPNGEECENFPHDDGFAGVVNAATDAAIAAEKGK